MATAGHYKAAKLFMSGHVLAVFTRSHSLTLEKQFWLNGSVEIDALNPSANCNKQNDSTLLHFHLKDIEHLHPQMFLNLGLQMSSANAIWERRNWSLEVRGALGDNISETIGLGVPVKASGILGWQAVLNFCELNVLLLLFMEDNSRWQRLQCLVGALVGLSSVLTPKSAIWEKTMIKSVCARILIVTGNNSSY